MQTKTNGKNSGTLIVLLCALLWALSGNFAQILFQTSEASVGFLTTVRMLLTGLLLLIYQFVTKPREVFAIFHDMKDTLLLIAFGVLGVMCMQYGYFAAIRYSNAATGTVLQYTYPILVLLYTTIAARKFPKSYEIGAIFAAFFGVLLISTHGNFKTLALSKESIFWGEFSAVCYVIYTVMPHRLYKKYGVTLVLSWAMLAGGLAIMFITGSFKNPPRLTFVNWLPILGIVVLGTIAPFTLFGIGTEKIGSLRASIIVTMEPLFSAVISAFMGTRFEAIDIVGFLLIVGAVEATSLLHSRDEKREMYKNA
jgi:Predicted permease, DMT superfamily